MAVTFLIRQAARAMFDAEKERAPQLNAEDGLASAGAIVSSASAGAIVKAAPQLVLYGASAGTW